MSNKSLKGINDILLPKGGTNHQDPAVLKNSFNNLISLVDDMINFRVDTENYTGPKEYGAIYDAAVALSSCSCNSREGEYCDCHGRTTSLYSSTCSCNGRGEPACQCNGRYDCPPNCDCLSRTTGCDCNGNAHAWCPSRTAVGCDCVSVSYCSCHGRTTCSGHGTGPDNVFT